MVSEAQRLRWAFSWMGFDADSIVRMHEDDVRQNGRCSYRKGDRQCVKPAKHGGLNHPLGPVEWPNGR